jgi:hypothetical protein
MLYSFLPIALVVLGAAALSAHEFFATLDREIDALPEPAWANNRPDVRNVSCVWAVCGGDADLSSPAFA